ncbi:unnamed protein product, partial [Tetraodon nigroviridis]
MNGGKDSEPGDDRQAVPVQVPIGWQRRAEPGAGVVYPQRLPARPACEQVQTYLLTDGTCKCGLECPLVLHKVCGNAAEPGGRRVGLASPVGAVSSSPASSPQVFNFDPGASVKQRTAEDVRADEDVTKLCIHKRKLLAVATLHKSMESHPPLSLGSPGREEAGELRERPPGHPGPHPQQVAQPAPPQPPRLPLSGTNDECKRPPSRHRPPAQQPAAAHGEAGPGGTRRPRPADAAGGSGVLHVPLPGHLPRPRGGAGPRPGGGLAAFSRSSSTSSDHGNFAMPSGHQATCGALKVPPRSPRSAMGSPKPSMPSSPSTHKGDPLYQYKDSQLLPGMGGVAAAGQQLGNPTYSPTSSSSSSSLATPSPSQKGHPGLLGMPLNQILNQQNAASFPASSLLSAAAKAQLANQNKLGAAASSAAAMAAMGPGGGGGCSNGHPRGMEGHSTLSPMLPPNSTVLLAAPEGQSGRAALRDKLMAHERDPLRGRRPSSGAAAGNHDSGGNVVYNMLSKRGAAGPHAAGPGAAEPLRKAGRLGNLPPSTSMAQLLQSMSCQSHRPCPSPGPGP